MVVAMAARTTRITTHRESTPALTQRGTLEVVRQRGSPSAKAEPRPGRGRNARASSNRTELGKVRKSSAESEWEGMRPPLIFSHIAFPMDYRGG